MASFYSNTGPFYYTFHPSYPYFPDPYPDRTPKKKPQTLDWKQRPQEIQKHITKTFERLAEKDVNDCGLYNGSREYEICCVDEYALMAKIIKEATSTQKKFYALDIGAGNFQWGKGLAEYLNAQTDLPSDIEVHIIGVRGEKYLNERVVTQDKCTLYQLGAFKIEELFEQFKANQFDLENQVDLIVSSWTFRHLVDPVGTFAQAYNLLRPKTGYFFFDGFFYFPEKESDTSKAGHRMLQLLSDTKAPFLTQHWTNSCCINRFALRRPDSFPCSLPMNYTSLETIDRQKLILDSGVVTHFKRTAPERDLDNLYRPPCFFEETTLSHYLQGDKQMYEYFKQGGLLRSFTFLASDGIKWAPLFLADISFDEPPLHKAVKEGNRKDVETCLGRGDDINASNRKSSTPLHIAVQEGNYESFSLLLSKNPLLELTNGEGKRPLHLAATTDIEGRFVQDLITQGSNINEDANYYKSPLSLALEHKNKKAAQLLVQAGAIVTKENIQGLKELGVSFSESAQ